MIIECSHCIVARKVRSLGGSPYWGRKRSGDPAEVVAGLDRGLITSNNYDNAGGKQTIM